MLDAAAARRADERNKGVIFKNILCHLLNASIKKPNGHR